ncbi:MAG: 30S ribosomal protein S12 methylthiotransferase RimO [Lachnospiraceae bacterium]|nr:30S ribosomal protein S12 methylthiotransferase RimO [Lachnospiraceae bacterium]
MKVFFASLGCDKNLVDSEVMLSLLAREGFEITDDETDAEIAVVNTCSFILDAKQESINTILELSDLKESKDGKLKVLIVCGCLAERYADELLEEIPSIDAVLGTMAIPEIIEAVKKALGGEKVLVFPSIDRELPEFAGRMVTTGGHYAYLKIAEGCDKHCTYCAIPSMRGKYRSYPIEHLVKESEFLVREVGAKELILVAQETTLYGVDLYGEKSLGRLLKELCKIEELKWVRILYCYPEEITEELIDVIASEPKVLHYLDVPIQHASDAILKRMGRRTSKAELKEKIAMMRRELPDICLRTTLISGFPGETEEDFEIVKEFIKEMRFDRLGVFAYSQEEGTPAAEMPNQIPEEIKEARKEELMLIQQEIAFEKADERIGEELEVLVEGSIPEDDVFVGRTYLDAPEVDGFVFFESDRELMSGDMVRVRITDCNEYDLIGEMCDEFTE